MRSFEATRLRGWNGDDRQPAHYPEAGLPFSGTSIQEKAIDAQDDVDCAM
jgi:hypothetical protein